MMAVTRCAAVPILGHQRGENALTQTSIGHAQALAWPNSKQRLEDGAASEHEIGALLADARLRHALGVAHADEGVRHAARVGGAEPAAIDAAAVVSRKAEVNSGDGGDRSRGAEEMRATVGD